MGWLFFVVAPVGAYATNWIIYEHLYLPLRFNQLAFSVSIGLLLNKSNCKRLLGILPQIRGLSVMVLFFGLEIIFGLMNPDATFWKVQLLHNYPLYIAAVIFSFSVIRSPSDLKLLVIFNIIAAIVISISAVFEMQYGFNINTYFCFKDFNRCHLSGKDWLYFSYADLHPKILDTNIFNKGAYSYYGFTSQPNLTSILIAVLSIISIVALPSVIKKRVLYYFVLLIMIASLMVSMISQIRAVIISIFVIFLVWGFLDKKVLYALFFMLLLVLFGILFVPSVNFWFDQFLGNRLNPVHLIDSQRTLAYKESVSLFLKSPFWGSLGTIYYAGDTLLEGNDANPYVLYFVSGGLILGCGFLVMLGTLIFDLLQLIGLRQIVRTDNVIVYANVAAIMFLLLTQLFNNNDVLFLIIIFYCTCRSSFVELNPKHSLNN